MTGSSPLASALWVRACAAALLTGTLAGALACSDSTAPSASDSFTSQVNADLAPTAGQDMANDYDLYVTASGTASGGTFSMNAPASDGFNASASLAPPTSAAATWISPSCTYSSTTQQFTCPTLTHGGRAVTVSYQLFDINGVTQSAYSTTTTASITFAINDTGAVAYSWNQNTYADTSSHHRVATVSMLQGDPDTVHVWNATSATNVHSVRAGQIAKTYQLSSNDTTTNVRIRQPRSLNPYPLSGTIVRNYTVVRTRAASDTTTHTATRRVVVTFNGTANVPMTVGTDQYMLNLDSRQVTKQ